MVGFEKYTITDHWNLKNRDIFPAEGNLFNAVIQDETDSDNPSIDSVRYVHNSLGYRGPEPQWGSPNIVFVGDENTKCLGVDDQHMWTTLVGSKLDRVPINLGRTNASNEWIAAQTIRVMEVHHPEIVVVQWTDPRRYLYVDEKARYRDFLPEVKIARDSMFSLFTVETARATFYEIDTIPNSLHRLLLNTILVRELAFSMDIRLVQVFSFLEEVYMKKLEGRVSGVTKSLHDHTVPDSSHCGNVDMYRLSEMIVEKIRSA